jgi:hypothetical protein
MIPASSNPASAHAILKPGAGFVGIAVGYTVVDAVMLSISGPLYQPGFHSAHNMRMNFFTDIMRMDVEPGKKKARNNERASVIRECEIIQPGFYASREKWSCLNERIKVIWLIIKYMIYQLIAFNGSCLTCACGYPLKS